MEANRNCAIGHFRFISSRYFEVMGIALRRGRFPAESDRSRKVAIVSESVARTLWPGEDAVGKRIQKGTLPVEVIGVVADVRTVSLDKQPPFIVYVPGDHGRIGRPPEIPEVLAGVFAASALLLAALGIYGVISYGVARRTAEMGIRMALGAQPSRVILMVLGQGMKPVLAGLLVGLLAALGAGRLLGSFLFGIGARDPATIAAVVILLLGVAAAACWVPARRAARTDPMIALRYE